MMAASPSAPVAGIKRGPGRPSKGSLAAKRPKLSTPNSTRKSTPSESQTQEGTASERVISGLPSRVIDGKPLPTLPRPQPTALSDEDYQSLSASSVLAASFERSRHSWMVAGIFERVYTRPTKNMVRPNKIDSKNFKGTGQCRIRIEPHMFEVETWVEKQRNQPIPSTPQIVNQPQQGISHQYQPAQGRSIQPAFSSTPAPSVRSPGLQQNAIPPVGQAPSYATPKPSQPAPSQDVKPSPDPVISMLANRASSDPQLKTLMKQVATGNATPEQLALFQQNIDELQKAVEEERKKREEEERQRVERERQQRFQQEQAQYYQRPAPVKTKTVPEKPAVIFQFTKPSLNDDRYLFPQHSILEYISSQHCLASFIVTRKGEDAADPTGLDPDTEYWQPITLLIECAYEREQPMKNIINWVKPAEEVRKYMQEVMSRCTRAPDAHLALRLPFKSTIANESEANSKEITPVVDDRTRGGKPMQANVKHIKPPGSGPKKKPAQSELKSAKAAGDEKAGDEKISPDGLREATAAAVVTTGDGTTTTSAVSATDEPASTATTVTGPNNNGRPRRTSRKSVRISEL